jgi:hypothetical protein
VLQNLVIGRYHIADATNRTKQLRREILVDFPPQPANLDIDHIGLRIKVIVLDCLEQHGASNNLALVPHQVFE